MRGELEHGHNFSSLLKTILVVVLLHWRQYFVPGVKAKMRERKRKKGEKKGWDSWHTIAFTYFKVFRIHIKKEFRAVVCYYFSVLKVWFGCVAARGDWFHSFTPEKGRHTFYVSLKHRPIYFWYLCCGSTSFIHRLSCWRWLEPIPD